MPLVRNSKLAATVTACCHRRGIKQVIDLEVLSSSDLCELCEGCSAETLTLAAAALADDNVQKFIDGKTLRKQIVVPGKLVNLVVA